MTLGEIIAEFKSTSAVPAMALAAGVVDEIAPVVYAIADKFWCGVHLLPADNELLTFDGRISRHETTAFLSRIERE